MKTTLVLTLMALSAGSMAAQGSMADTLRKGVVEEESQHNLAAAVKDYQAVVAQFDEQRKTAATAVFRLAECYRQQHKDTEAKMLYRRVVQEFGDQSKLAEQSRTVLSGTYKIDSDVPPEALQVAANMRDARERYRMALLQEIQLADDAIARVQHLIDLGTVGQEALIDARRQKLVLDRELAAFDMGIIPSDLQRVK